MLPVFITPEGVLLLRDKTPNPAAHEVEEVEVDEPLHVAAAREAARQSTTKVTKQ